MIIIDIIMPKYATKEHEYSMNDVYKSLEEDDTRASGSQSTSLKISSRWPWLDGLLDLGEICFPDHGTLQSASMASADSKDGLATSAKKQKAVSSPTSTAAAQAHVSTPPRFVQQETPTKKVEDPNGAEFKKLVSWTKDISKRKSAAAQVNAQADAFAQELRKKPGQGQADDGNVILLSEFSKQTKLKEDAKGNAIPSPSPSKKRLFKKGKGSTKGKTSSATSNKKEESSSSPPKATQPKPKAVQQQQQQQATEERQETNDDWRRVTWRSMVTNKAPNPKASQNIQNNKAPAYDHKRDISGGVFIPPQSVYGSPMSDPGCRYGVPPGSPQSHHYGQHYPPQHPRSPYGGPYSPHHQQQYLPQQQYHPQQHYPPSPQQHPPPQHQYKQNYPPQYNPNVNSPAAAHHSYGQGQARSPRFAA